MFSVENIEAYRPAYYLRSLSEAWLNMLAGVEAVFTDLDCVLADPRTSEYNAWAIRLLRRAKEEKDISKFAIVTNTLGNSDWEKRAERIRDYFSLQISWPIHLECLTIKEKKPSSIGFERAMAELGVIDPSTVMMFGDQFVTDIYGANCLGMKTCLVDPFGTQGWITRIFNGRKSKRIHRRLGLEYSW